MRRYKSVKDNFAHKEVRRRVDCMSQHPWTVASLLVEVHIFNNLCETLCLKYSMCAHISKF